MLYKGYRVKYAHKPVKSLATKINVRNSRKGKVYKSTIKNVLDEIYIFRQMFDSNQNNDNKELYEYKFYYKDFKCSIRFAISYMGYVEEFDKKIKNKFTKKQREDLGSIKNIYVPHGGFTHPIGFDMAHLGDIMILTDGKTINISPLGKNASFKTFDYVKSELKKIVDSLIKIKS